MIQPNAKKTIRPRQLRAIRSKESILAAAGEVFAEKGLAGARIDAIARAAGVNKQRIYAYFGSKEALYREVLLKVYGAAAANEALMGLGAADIPRMTGVILNTFFDFHARHPQFWRLLSWENLNGGQSLSAEDWKALRSVYIQHLRELYATGQENGVFRAEISFEAYLLTIFSLTYFYFSNQTTISQLMNLSLQSSQVQQRLAEEINQILTCGILGQGPPNIIIQHQPADCP